MHLVYFKCLKKKLSQTNFQDKSLMIEALMNVCY